MTDIQIHRIDLEGEPFSYCGNVKCNVTEVEADGPDPDRDYGPAYRAEIIEACEGSLTITRAMMVQAYGEAELRGIEEHIAECLAEGEHVPAGTDWIADMRREDAR